MLKENQQIPDHFHNGFDSSRVYFQDINMKKVYVHHSVIGNLAAAVSNYAVFWIAPFPCVVIGFQEVHGVAGTDGGAVTLQLEKLNSGENPDTGDEILASTINLKAAPDIIQTGTMATTLSVRQLIIGDRLCLKDSGTLTNVTNVTVMVEILVI